MHDYFPCTRGYVSARSVFLLDSVLVYAPLLSRSLHCVSCLDYGIKNLYVKNLFKKCGGFFYIAAWECCHGAASVKSMDTPDKTLLNLHLLCYPIQSTVFPEFQEGISFYKQV